MYEQLNGKNENLTVLQGGIVGSSFRGRRRGRRPGARVLSTVERELEREMREGYVRLKTPDGNTPSRGIAAIVCADGATPWRTVGLRMMEAIDAGCDRAAVRRLAEILLTWVDRRLAERDRKLGALDRSPLTSGEFPRAA